MILVIDFGGQTAHLISRRLRDLGVEAKFMLPEEITSNPSLIKRGRGDSNISGIILSGGPMSVYEKDAPTIDKKIFTLGIPVLGICYGFHLIAHLLGGKVISGRKEYGPAELRITNHAFVPSSGQGESRITNGLPRESVVWMNHGDEIISLPKDFVVIGETAHVPFAFSVSEKRKIYGILFHPEVEHTEYGNQILTNFLEICGETFSVIPSEPQRVEESNSRKRSVEIDPSISLRQVPYGTWLRFTRDDNVKKMIQDIRNTVGSSHVIGAISGGVDSTVAAALVAKSIDKQFTPIFVNNGLMRSDAEESVKKLAKLFNLKPVIINCEDEMLKRLRGIAASEEKRKVIGKHYIEVFEEQMYKIITPNLPNIPKIPNKAFLLQGTIYSDVIESQGTKHASKIKSHHNVGGLPQNMRMRLLEPLREMYKDEVRQLGRQLGLPEEFVMRQPFPGPGYAVRIRGEVTKKRLDQEKHADSIVLEELKKAGWLEKIFISFPVMTGAYSTAVKGDAKFFGEVIALRVVQSKDIMTATWAHLPYELLQTISSRIVNEVPDISRVVYDISTKPPATMEWE